MPTKIEWCEETWNPVTGCSWVSRGCDNCYAKRMANRLRGRYGYPKDNPFKVTLHPDRLDQPLKWRKPRMIFVCSMGDLFHKDVPDSFIFKVFQTMFRGWFDCNAAKWGYPHTHIVLTKRPKRMVQFWKKYFHDEPCPKYIWLGVSVEDQPTADERIPELLKVPAAVRLVSIEPCLSEINIEKYLHCGIMWCIIGSETGPQVRPMKEDWVRKVVLQCKKHSVPLFYKQIIQNGKKVSTPLLDGKRYVEYPQITSKRKGL